jgi:hypothetical protein
MPLIRIDAIEGRSKDLAAFPSAQCSHRYRE